MDDAERVKIAREAIAGPLRWYREVLTDSDIEDPQDYIYDESWLAFNEGMSRGNFTDLLAALA